MATLYDLAMQYLNQSLPKTFKYDRTNQPGTNPPPVTIPPQDPNAPTARILPVQGGGGGGGGGSNNPYDLSTDFSQITSDRQKRLSQDPTGLNKFLINTLGMKRPQTAEDIVNLGYRTPSKFGIGALLPDKYGELPRADQAFIASRMGYTGPTVFGANDSGLSKDPFGLNTRSGFGNYAERVGVESEKALDNLNRLGDKYNATWNDELGTYVGPGAKKANQITSMIQSKRNFYKGEDVAYKDYQNQVQNVLDADKEFSTEGDSSNYGIDGYPTYDIKDIQGEDNEEFDPTSLDYTNPNIYNTKNIYTSVPESTYDEEIFNPGDGTGSVGSVDPAGINSIDSTVYANENNPSSVSTSGLTYNQGGGQDGSYDEAGVNTGLSYNQGGGSSGSYDEAGINTGPTVGNATAKNTYTDAILRGNTGGGNDSSSNSRDKIVCTMMNESYGFGSFRNKIWLKHSKGLAPEYQKGYHKIFLPLIKIAKTNKVVRKILEHIAVHRTIDIRQESRGKVHLLGRVYRKILEPICYFVGKHGKSSS